MANLNTSKIKKFIEKQKKRNAERKKDEKTIEQEKYMRVHQNLINLHNFTINNRIKNSSTNANHTRQTSKAVDSQKVSKSLIFDSKNRNRSRERQESAKERRRTKSNER